MTEYEIKNARIESTSLGFERGVFFSFRLMLDYGCAGQGAGGLLLAKKGDPDKTSGCSMSFLADLLKVIGVNSWEDLKGAHVRVRASFTNISSIGNVLKDEWLDLSDINQYVFKPEGKAEDN